MPRSTPARISEIISCLSAAGPYPKLIPIQPSPMADTSRLLFPSLRFCIVSPSNKVKTNQPQRRRVTEDDSKKNSEHTRSLSCILRVSVPLWRVPFFTSPLSLILFVADFFHPFDGLAVELFHNGDVRHRCGLRGAVPMLFTRRAPNHIARPNFFFRAAFALNPSTPGRDDQGLP